MRREKRDEFGLPAGQVAGFAVLFAALLASFFIFPGNIELVFGLVMAAAGAGKLVIKHLEAHPNDELPPASAAFRALADPTRPLTERDPISIAPPQPALPAEAEPRAGS
ncbi:MAG TPA: hypothetical protein VGO40_21440 [Longimicrobium sp.]|jgi:hypothetical protein|nr:hypothetical protein [Longimicrobium sp.]